MAGVSVHLLVRKVDLLTLRLFLSAIEEQQIGLAAARENIAASAATRRIKDLENFVGLALLDRTPRGVTPTRAGRTLEARLRAIFEHLEHIRIELGEYTEGVCGHVRIASTSAMLVQQLARQIGDFVQNFPLIDIEMQESINPAVVRAVQTGEVDIGVFAAAPSVGFDDLETVHYRTDRVVAIAPVNHAFAERNSVGLDDLLDARLIGIQAATTMMTEIRNAARGMGRELKPKYSVDSVDAARSLVLAGLGVTIQPECMLPQEYLDRLVILPIAETWAERQLMIATHRSRPLSAAARLLIEHLTFQPEGDDASASA